MRERVKPLIEPLLALAVEKGWNQEDVVLWLCSPTSHFRDESRPVDHLDEVEAVLEVASRAWGVKW